MKSKIYAWFSLYLKIFSDILKLLLCYVANFSSFFCLSVINFWLHKKYIIFVLLSVLCLSVSLFVNFKLIFLNIKFRNKTQHTNIWPIYIYVHTVIRLCCCSDVKATLSCLVFYSFVLSFIRWRWKITIIYLVYIHTLYVFSWK